MQTEPQHGTRAQRKTHARGRLEKNQSGIGARLDGPQADRQYCDIKAVDCLREIARFAVQGIDHHRPFNLNGSLRKQGSNEEKCIRYAELLRSVAVALAVYEAPKLAPIKMAPPPPTDKPLNMTVRIFDHNRKHVRTIVDGERVWDAEESAERRNLAEAMRQSANITEEIITAGP